MKAAYKPEAVLQECFTRERLALSTAVVVFTAAILWPASSFSQNGTRPIDYYIDTTAFSIRNTTEHLPPWSESLQEELANQVEIIVNGPELAPLRVSIGLAGSEYFFDQSGETLHAVSLSLPHLPEKLRRRSIDYLIQQWVRYPVLSKGCKYPLHKGKRRELYWLPSEVSKYEPPDSAPMPFANMYAVWEFAYYADQWNFVASKQDSILAAWQEFRSSDWTFDAEKGDLFANAYLAGLIGFVRVAERLGLKQEAAQARIQAAALADGIVSYWNRQATGLAILQFEKVQEFDRWRRSGPGKFFHWTEPHKAKPAVFHMLAPEVGWMLSERAPQAAKTFDRFVDRSLPGWYLVGEERQFHFGENFMDYPDLSMAIFQAKAFVTKVSAEKLAGWVDMPLCAGDLYWIEKAAITLHVAATGR